MDYKKLAIIGGSLVGAGALFYYLYNSKVQVKKAAGKTLPREIIISTLKQLKKELFTVCVQMSLMANEMKRYSQGRLDYDIKDFIFSYSSISQEIQASIKKAYDKNGVTEVDFQYNCEVTFATDDEIQTMMKSIKSMVDNAAEGKQMDIQAEIPEFLTQEKLLEIIEKIMIETTKSMQQLFKKIKDQYGELNLNDPRIQRSLQTLKTDEIKDSIFNQYNLEDFEDPASKIIQCATQKYAMEHPEFQEKMMQLELKQRKSMEVIMQNPEKEGAVEDIFNEPAQSMGMGMGMGGGFPGFHSSKRKNQSKEEKKEEAPAVKETATQEENKPQENEDSKVEEKQENQQAEQEKVEEQVVEQENKEENIVEQQKDEEHNIEQEKKEEQHVQEEVIQHQEEVRQQVDIQESVEVVNEKSNEEEQQQQQQAPEHQE
ncbi:transmembrane protein, putative (macronuclear) [Tetrahymena thermophila SB210]|uniref:Transmembrane protein, putative n=1 Tax=Tetrahymena thermophila (strain SB210) TaxID=312017 RepID=I7M7A9_TETTS|nr:transmembrane protein, putative [Tetrahymena thermophila SB210]EAR90885.3 transmembrane protein, putative [Tetrahymena thermophila SB210]|eukprot:XP_001011130.3 transmembrane protein, putative [Tetrahymena thermophila SB210]